MYLAPSLTFRSPPFQAEFLPHHKLSPEWEVTLQALNSPTALTLISQGIPPHDALATAEVYHPKYGHLGLPYLERSSHQSEEHSPDNLIFHIHVELPHVRREHHEE